MSADDGGPGDREVAFRVFAAEYDDADYSYSESDEERAPNYVVTPTGARINRLFAVGVLTEVEPVNEEMLRARVVDPTGAFVVYAGQYQPDALAFLERADPPAFVAVTGKARTFEPDDADRVYTSVRPESISEVGADTRDRWVVQTAQQTLDRVQTMAGTLASDARGDDLAAALREQGTAEELAAGIPRAIDHYGTTPTYLAAVRDLAVGALRVVAGDQEEVDRLDVAPGDPGDVTATDLAGGDVAFDVTATADPAETDAATGASTEEPTGETDAAADVTSTGSSTAATGEPSGETTSEPAETATGTADESGGSEPATATAGTSGDATTDPATADPAAETTVESGTDDVETVTDVETPTGDEDDDLGDFDGEFELDEEERQEIEEEYGTEFSTGSEVEAPGEAGIEPEAPEEVSPDEPEPKTDAPETDAPEPAEPEEPAETDESTAVEESTGAEEPADAEASAGDEETGDVDLEDAVLETMRELDDGDGADREAVVSAVAESYGVDPGAVEDTIEDALMSGQCYEPSEDRLKAI